MPLYEYKCGPCEDEWETYHKVDNRSEEYCMTCTEKAEIQMSVGSRPVIQEYWDRGLSALVTGPQQRKKLAKSKGLEEM